MSFLLDTNVLSEVVRKKPNPQVLAWFEATPSEALYISVLTLGELRRGIEAVQGKAHHEKLRYWLETDLPSWFGPRILPVDLGVAERWGRLLGSANRSVPAIDGLLAATALHNELSFVTRNVRDVEGLGLDIVNPWAQ